jgi:hypothetical protein
MIAFPQSRILPSGRDRHQAQWLFREPFSFAQKVDEVSLLLMTVFRTKPTSGSRIRVPTNVRFGAQSGHPGNPQHAFLSACQGQSVTILARAWAR